jgi:UDP-glucose 4-epimerase
LLRQGHHVTGYDNLSTGQSEFLDSAKRSPHFDLILADLLDAPKLQESMRGSDFVFHFAANADVRFGLEHPRKDLEQNTIATFHVLEAMRANQITRIAFSSTGSIYGDADVIPTPEDSPFPVQTSLYGASKLACEGLIQAYCEGYNFHGYIFRFVSVLGERYTHGHVFDFYKQLKNHPDHLNVLGDGTQRKSYLHIQDCLDAMLLVIEQVGSKVNIFNLGTDEYCTVNDSIGWICENLKIQPAKNYSGGKQGWIGDNPFIFLDCTRIKNLGWRAQISIKEGIISTLDYLKENTWLLERR